MVVRLVQTMRNTPQKLSEGQTFIWCHSLKFHAQTAAPVVNEPLVARRVKFTSTTNSYQLASATLTHGAALWFLGPPNSILTQVPLSRIMLRGPPL